MRTETNLITGEVTTHPDAPAHIFSAQEIEYSRIVAIKAEAKSRICAYLPDSQLDNYLDKEINLLMLNAELDEIRATGTLTAEQQITKDKFISMKDAFKDIRAMSNLAEANGYTVEEYRTALDDKGY